MTGYVRVCVCALFLAAACGDSTGGPVIDGPPGGGTIDGPPGGGVIDAGGGVVVGGDAGTWTCYPVLCENHSLECNDCVDNDGDGEVDSHDRECLGPCDNTEGPGLNGGVGGETGGPCKADCYFDFGNGSGGQDCVWDHSCDPLAVPPNYPPEGPDCAYDPSMVGTADCPDVQPANCLPVCGPLTPNGCDCFGCCEFPELATAGPGGTQGYVWIGALVDGEGSCTFDVITDQLLCPPCTPVAECLNGCDPCEVCIGAPPPGPECFEGDAGPGDQCPGGEQPCGLAGQPECPENAYCISGCCQVNIP